MCKNTYITLLVLYVSLALKIVKTVFTTFFLEGGGGIGMNNSFLIINPRESKLRLLVLEGMAAITPLLSRETILDKGGNRDTTGRYDILNKAK